MTEERGPDKPAAGLYVVATPIGNAADLSPRAAGVLAGADMILAEDTRRAGLLLKRLGIAGNRFVSFHDHNEAERLPQVLGHLRAGGSAALVSDAGTPLLSDPGYRLVGACREEGIRVSPVPGPCSFVAALSAAGLPPQPFVFLGFLPRSAGDVRKTLAPFAALPATLAFFERKSRLAASLGLAHEVLGERTVCVARELTKVHEEFILGELSALARDCPDVLGEITVLVGPPRAPGEASEDDIEAVLAEEAARGGKPREVARRAAARLPGTTAKELYGRLAAAASRKP
ncbi:Ribosomal RNA small subunit methyltransferase I [Desulfovibrio sp. X2]|uniref:16S rRNA (cytidine(1402)-2'-O)-methyltransferase n=1 Tax=Desulfovibrio sp. X2 TaxID=941449 RepID=UPI000358E54D|nr:16S rRNA (cytidine(1402)-2'-O)-methyltransferase [Desulfovibrio sp. X2]EPR41681.1 Ribosomal RNA small subunit methyltransferase I [Desulfovibrio sp. X2]